MFQNFPIGISDFREIIQTKSIFIDKTLFIKDIMDNNAKVILITRPRRFGKTMNMSMLQRFLGIHEDSTLFDNLKIKNDSEFCAQHQNKYPIIFLSFKDLKDKNFSDIYFDIRHLFATLYKEHNYLLEDNTLSDDEKILFKKIQNKTINDPSDLSFALFNLISYVHKRYGVPPILLLDEYDTPIHSAYEAGYYEDMVNLMRKILGSALKDNVHLGKAVLTGITRVSQESLFSGLNNVEVYTMLSKSYSSYFGFTEEEVMSLLPSDLSIEPIREWYNGYTIGNLRMYNPWSIINCLKQNGDLSPHWMNTSNNKLVIQLIEDSKPEVKEQFEELIEGKSLKQTLQNGLTFSYLNQDENAIWTLLFHTGYLNAFDVKTNEKGQLIANVAIPNKEVRSIYTQWIEKWFLIENKRARFYDELLEHLEEGNVEQFASHVQEYIRSSSSYFDFSKNTHERVFHVFMLGLLVGLREKYEISSNKEAGLGRCDMVFIPKNTPKNGIILEFKVASFEEDLEKTAENALSQIQQKSYTDLFLNKNISQILCIGMAFCGKRMKTRHTVLNCSSGDFWEIKGECQTT